MRVQLQNPPYIFARNPAGRVVQIRGQAGDVGRIANLVVPDERTIERLRPAIRYFQKLPSQKPQHRAEGSNTKYSDHLRRPAKPMQFSKTDDLPLVAKHL